ncbi:TetR family transcriptional regulator [Tamaricihabitans halophyticus]|uniref:TetR family transcriptional regulator n=2 Tax=Tamaricihabitans halophyticus TaxID=1262583 RepID=A0A4R2QK02_9PSEU|nr:TetR family transcriptional regulator [Tamaricihabitans halophyticus]
MYSEATRAALLDEATRLFAERGYAETSLADIAVATQVTRGAVYHHFEGKQALFEAVLDRQEANAVRVVREAAVAEDPLVAALQALDAFLEHCDDPVYGRLCWQEGPVALGFRRWREYEQRYFFGLVEQFVEPLFGAGYLDPALPRAASVQFFFWNLGGAGLALAEADVADRSRIRAEWRELIGRTILAFQPPAAG